MADYKTPGVYVEEISKLPASAGQVPTAIPAFIGYTERAQKNGKALLNTPTFISSLLEYESIFGTGYEPKEIKVSLDDNNGIEKVEADKTFYLYNSVRLFYANGGGQAFVVSVGSYAEDINAGKLEKGLDACKKEDLVTILLMPDAVLLPEKAECYALQQQMLMQCNKLQDRVTVLDIYDGYLDRSDADVVTDFRNGIGVNFLKYGASYYPWIQTTFTTDFGFQNIKITDSSKKTIGLESLVSDPSAVNHLNEIIADLKVINGYLTNVDGTKEALTLVEKFNHFDKKKINTFDEITYKIGAIKGFALKLIDINENGSLTNNSLKNELSLKLSSTSVFANIVRTLTALDLAAGTNIIDPSSEFKDYELSSVKPIPGFPSEGNLEARIQQGKQILKSLFESFSDIVYALKRDGVSIEEHFDKVVYNTSPLYKNIITEVNRDLCKVPPSGAVAGVYAQVDSDKGVWKAPANVSLAACVKPWVKIDNDQQETLNVDLIGGKSVNAIRAFVGQGNLIWGARTLAGNDNEWRYVSVRRFYNMVEKSLKLATNWAVFEPNTEITWIKVKGMITNFLNNLWKAGALMGGTPDEAFFVNIGLGSTMTMVDVLEGKMIVEIGLAVVRPAEFIVLRFSHKMGDSE